MKAISSKIIVTSLRSRRDQSAGISIETPILTDEEFTAWRAYQGINSEVVISPVDQEESGIIKIENDLENRSQAQRFRAVVALVCKRLGRPEDADKVYFREMEALIDKYKEKLD